jgi:hypothetical protein
MKKNYIAPVITNYGGLEVITQATGNRAFSDILTLSNVPGFGTLSGVSSGSKDVSVDFITGTTTVK